MSKKEGFIVIDMPLPTGCAECWLHEIIADGACIACKVFPRAVFRENDGLFPDTRPAWCPLTFVDTGKLKGEFDTIIRSAKEVQNAE